MRFSLSTFILVAVLLVSFPTESQALSCLSVEEYLKTTVGNEEIVIFTASTKATMEKDGYTAEAVTVTKSHQGYVESDVMVYHQKDETWGYLCNNGPKGNNTTGLYVTERDALGMYQVTQRLDIKDSVAVDFLKQLEANNEVSGEVVTLTKEDRIARIYGSINDLFATLGRLLGELAYWSQAK